MIRYLVMDVDGTLTDGKIYMGASGEMMKAFNIKDGFGIRNMIIPAGIIPIITTGRTSRIVQNRCRELGVENVFQNVENKLQKLKELSIDMNSIAYIGDDINDLECMTAIKKAGGVVGCPADAVERVKKIADYISSHKGGEGAVRDFIEWLLADQLKHEVINV